KKYGAQRICVPIETACPRQQVGKMLAARNLIGAGKSHLSLHRCASKPRIREDLVEAELIAGMHDIIGERALTQRQHGSLCRGTSRLRIYSGGDKLHPAFISPIGR